MESFAWTYYAGVYEETTTIHEQHREQGDNDFTNCESESKKFRTITLVTLLATQLAVTFALGEEQSKPALLSLSNPNSSLEDEGIHEQHYQMQPIAYWGTPPRLAPPQRRPRIARISQHRYLSNCCAIGIHSSRLLYCSMSRYGQPRGYGGVPPTETQFSSRPIPVVAMGPQAGPTIPFNQQYGPGPRPPMQQGKRQRTQQGKSNPAQSGSPKKSNKNLKKKQ